MAVIRRLSFLDTIEAWRSSWRPDCAFHGRTAGDFRKWRKAFSRHYTAMMGEWPRRAGPAVKVLRRWTKPGYRLEKIVYTSSPHVHVPAYRLTPAWLKVGQQVPGILAAHGHGAGKADISGMPLPKTTRNHLAFVQAHNYDYAVQAARHGYVVIAPDWIPFGERALPPNYIRTWRDACDVASMASLYFGISILTQNVWDGMRAVDLLSRDPHVDARRLGVIGLSYGGTMTSHLLVNDPRLKVGVVSGYVSTVREDALTRERTMNSCGAQHLPGLLRHGDLPEVLGLAAPKPMLCEVGTHEDCFHFPDMKRAFARLSRIYAAAGATDRLEADVFVGKHMWSGRKAWSFLEKWL